MKYDLNIVFQYVPQQTLAIPEIWNHHICADAEQALALPFIETA